MRLHRLVSCAAAVPLLATLATACTPRARVTGNGMSGPAAAFVVPGTEQEDVREEVYALADDSMMGRFTGSEGAERAARYIAGKLRHFAVHPAGDGGGFLQRMPIAYTNPENPRRGIRLLNAWADTAGYPRERRGSAANVVGIIPGTDPELRNQVVLIDAHYDHIGAAADGACRPIGADAICNGADDDASGVVTVLEIAREFHRGPGPKRTVVLLLTTGEEVGLLGTQWYIRHPVRPLETTVANMEIEMIGRPDPMVGGVGRAWLTGFDRSTMGEMLAAAGIPIVNDPRPDQNFFERSDNIAFARLGIPAHTLSSFNLHGDYHTPRDEASRIDYAHMTQVIRAAVRAARILADGPAPVWKPGGRPEGGP